MVTVLPGPFVTVHAASVVSGAWLARAVCVAPVARGAWVDPGAGLRRQRPARLW